MAGKSVKVWKYELVAVGGSPGDFVVSSSSEFKAPSLAAAKSFLAGAVSDIPAQGFPVPNAIRLIDPGGEEIWRALIAGPRPAVGRPVDTRHHALRLARRKRRHY